MKRFLKSLVICLVIGWGGFVIPVAKAQKTVLLNDSNQVINLGPHLKYFRDDAQRLILSDILSESYQKKFIGHQKATLNLGPGEATVWIKLKIKATRLAKYLLEFGHTGMEQIVLYQQNAQQQFMPTDTLGDNIPYHQRKIKSTKFLFELNLQDHEVHTIYLRCQASELLLFPLQIGNYQAFLEQNHQEDFIMGGFYGLVLIMIFYNLFIWITTRQLSYLC